MKQREVKLLEKIALERGGSVTKRRIQKVKDDEKRLYDNRQDRICNNLSVGLTVVVQDNKVTRVPSGEKTGG